MKPTNIVCSCDGKWKIDQGVCEWYPGPNNAWKTITIDDSKFSLTSIVDQICSMCSVHKNEHDLKLSYLPPTNPCYKPRPVYLETSECLTAYLAFGGASERPLLHVELIKRIQSITKGENEVIRSDTRDRVGENDKKISSNNVTDSSSSSDEINEKNTDNSARTTFGYSDGYPDGLNFSLNQEFGSKEEFINALDNIAVAVSFMTEVLKSSNTQHSVRCLDRTCAWKIRAVKIKGSDRFFIQSYVNTHTCIERKGNALTISVALVADILVEKYKEQEEVPATKEIMTMMQKKGIEISYEKARTGKDLAEDTKSRLMWAAHC